MLINNYLTLDKGKLDEISEGMGVIGPEGVVGRVYSVSDHFSLVISLLHSESLISSIVKRENILCSTSWDGRSPQSANLLHVPRHFHPEVGDSVVTSSFNAIYPPGVMIGTIESVEIDEGATFYEIGIDLATDFNSLSTVYVLYDSLRSERAALEAQTPS
jgi:rod shape-determining protein MreC